MNLPLVCLMSVLLGFAASQMTVVYWPTLNQGKEAGDIGYSDRETLRAWIKANKARLKTE